MRDEARALLRLAGPLFLTQLGGMLLGVVDTAVVGRMSESALAAVGLGAVLYFAVNVVGFGWMLALDPLIAQALGAGERERAKELFWQGLWVALAGALPLSGLTIAIAQGAPWLGLPEEVVAHLAPYLEARVFGILPFLMLAGARAFLQAHEVTRPLVIGVVVANVLNLPLSWGLVFGELGLPRLGVAGAGWASTFATIVQVAVALVAVQALWGAGPKIIGPRAADVKRVLRLGTPIGLQLLAEVGSFAIVGVLAANVGTRAVAAHNVALTSISLTFQGAVAIGAAAAVRVGHAVGRDDSAAARRAGLTAIGLGGAMMLIGAAAFVAFPRSIARVVTDEVAIVEAAAPLFMVAAAFQISDGVQAIAAGTLRGAGDTRWPLFANLVGHYAIGVPVGATLAFVAGWGAVGLWWGLSAGLTAVAIALTVRFATLSRGPIARA